MLAGLGLGAVFVRRQLRLPEPLVDLRLFRNPGFSVALATSLASFFVIGGMALFVVQFLQSVLGLSALQAGLWTVPEAMAFIAASVITPRLATRATAASLLAASATLGAVGYLIVASAGGQLAPVVVGTTIGGLGLAAIVTLVTDIAVGAVSPAHAGAAAALSETSSELGGALGLAVLGSIGTAIYRAGLPAGTPHSARQTIGDAVAHGGDVTTAATGAFSHALSITATVSAVLMLTVAGIVLAVLHRPAPAPTPQQVPAHS
jgi:MFS transporter, DHA2 family, multidrug resistance protein